jgi:hypothetical protein
MFGFGGRKKDKDGAGEIRVKGVKGEIEEKKPRKKKEEAKGSNWAAAMVLLVTIILGVVFWIYGRVSGGGSFPRGVEGERKVENGVIENEEGVIIFEK